MQSLTYRQATIHDAPAMQTLGLLAYGAFYPELEPEHKETMDTNLRKVELYPNLLSQATGFVCCESDTLAGMAFLVPNGNPTAIYPAEWSYIRMVGVNPGYQNRGIARKLTQMCIDHARAIGEHTISLHTSEMMNAARHIYESLGFAIERKIPPIFGKRYWLYKLAL